MIEVLIVLGLIGLGVPFCIISWCAAIDCLKGEP